jgi:hypothetical protein
MKRVSFLIILCIIVITKTTNAQRRASEKEVKTAAISTFYKKAEMLKISPDTIIKTINSFRNTDGDSLMYEVIFKNGAAILLSGSKACQPVLGYYTKSEEDNGSIFDTNNINVPPGLRALLNDYAQMIEWSLSQDSVGLSYESEWSTLQRSYLHKSNSPTAPYIGPFLKTKWGQSGTNNNAGNGYDYYVTESGNNCSRCKLGCAAVAMGQVMKHWNYPVYWFNTGAQYYDWCNMPDTLLSSSPNYIKERHAVARLLRDCGVAANTTYCISGCESSALLANVRTALINDFGYSSNAVRRDRSSYNDNNWKGFIRNDLDNGRPVIYGSSGTWFDGHYWVLDGYDSDDQFHFKWGWTGTVSGSFDGWYTLNEITNINGHNFRWSQRAIFKIYPAMNQDYCNYDLSLYDYYVSKLSLIMIYLYNGFSVPPEIWNAIHTGIPTFATTLTSINPNLYPNSPFPIPEEWHTIKAGQSVEYVAHETIRLRPGFRAEAGSLFRARIEPCASCGSTSKSTLLLAQGGDTSEFYDFNNFNDSTLHKSIKNHLREEEINQNRKINIIPNPNNGTFTISTNIDPQEVISVQIFSIVGQSIYKQEGLPNNVIQLPATTKGMFFVEIKTQKEKFVRKMVVN